MARQAGLLKFTGTMGGVTGYLVDGVYMVKQKNSAPSKNRYQNSRAYANVRRNAGWFAQAQQLAQVVYHQLQPDRRSQKKIWYPLRNRAQELVRAGCERAEILKELREVVLPGLVEKAFPEKVVQVIADVRHVENTAVEEIQLGRYYGRVDNLRLMDELAAANAVMRSMIRNGKDEKMSLAMVEYKGLRETRRR